MGEAFVLVVNPRAGAGAAGERLPALRRALDAANVEHEVTLTAAPRDATIIVRRALEGGAPGVVVVGGDGTLSEAANGFFDECGEPFAQDRWLAPLSCGTGGDFRRTIGASNKLGSSSEIRAAVRRILDGEPRPVDAGRLSYVDDAGGDAACAFLNIASFGLSGLVDRLVNQSPKWMGGTGAFVLGTLRGMARYSNAKVTLSLDDGPPREASILNVAVANGQFFGGGMRIAPRAKIDDGLFDVVSLELTPRQALTSMPRVYTGGHVGRPGVRYERARKVVATALGPEPVLLDVDGEAPGRLPATFEVAPGALMLRG